MTDQELCVTTITIDFPCTVKQEYVTQQHEIVTSGPSCITLCAAARVIIIPLDIPFMNVRTSLAVPQEDGSKITYNRDDNTALIPHLDKMFNNTIEVQRDDRTSFTYERDPNGIWTSEDIKVRETYEEVGNKDKAFLPRNEDDRMDFLCAYEENNFSSPQLHVDKLPIDEVPQSPNEKIISSITGIDMIYEINTDDICNTNSIDVVTSYETVVNAKDNVYLPYQEEDRNAFIDSLNEANLVTRSAEVAIPIQISSMPQCKGFILGRKAQFISDYYPLVSRDKGRANKMSKLLPSLIANNTEIKNNYYLCIESSKKRPNLDSYSHPDIVTMTSIDQYKLGRDYQFLQDSNCVRGNLDLLTPDQIKEQACSFRKKLNEGYFNLRKNREAFQRRLDRTDILECRGDKCRIDYEDGDNEHCESCYGELTIEDIAKALHGKSHNNGYYGEYSDLERIIRES